MESRVVAKVAMMINNKSCLFHQTLHLTLGFIGEPTGHWNSLENSSKLLNAPITRNLPGECTAVFILFLLASRLISPHQT